MITGDGNQFEEVGNKVYHYARWDINPNVGASEREYLEFIKENNPIRARTVYYGLPGSSQRTHLHLDSSLPLQSCNCKFIVVFCNSHQVFHKEEEVS